MNRLLSSSESFFANLCERGTNTIGVVWTVTGPITSDLLCSALDHLGTVHPYLRSEIAVGDNKDDKYERKWKPIGGRPWYSFEKVDPIFSTSYSDSISRQALNVLEKTFLEPFTPGDDTKPCSPLARPDGSNSTENKSDIVCAVSHGLMDGRSTTLLLDHLLLTMSEIYNGKKPSLTALEETKLPEAEALAGINDEKRNDTFASLPIDKKVSAKERIWAISSYTIKKQDSFFDDLKKLCKTHGVSINAAILASFVEATDVSCKKHGMENNSPFFHIVSAVDVGGELSGRQICSSHVIAVLSEIEKTSELTFWDIAKIYQQKLVKSVEGKKWLPTNPSHAQFFEAEAIDQTLFDPQGRVNSFTLSNMGDLNRLFGSADKDIWSHSPFHVTDQILGSCFVVGAAFFNGNLNLSFGFPSPTYDRFFMDELAKLAITLLRQNSKSE